MWREDERECQGGEYGGDEERAVTEGSAAGRWAGGRGGSEGVVRVGGRGTGGAGAADHGAGLVWPQGVSASSIELGKEGQDVQTRSKAVEEQRGGDWRIHSGCRFECRCSHPFILSGEYPIMAIYLIWRALEPSPSPSSFGPIPPSLPRHPLLDRTVDEQRSELIRTTGRLHG